MDNGMPQSLEYRPTILRRASDPLRDTAMNRNQKILALVAAGNLALLLLFPPFLETSLRARSGAQFESFYFIFSALGRKEIFSQLLTIEVFFVLINALAGWLALNRPPATPGEQEVPVNFNLGITLFGFGNFALIFLFPPFEHYSSLMLPTIPGFDSFYFVLGDKMHRKFFAPLLYLECVLVIANLLTLWLLFSIGGRTLPEVAHAAPSNPHHHLPPHPDRRQHLDPKPHNPERRSGHERRLHPRA
jgi:hypothetical protein